LSPLETSRPPARAAEPASITEIDRCRISGSTHLVSVLNLGEQSLTGVFPKDAETAVTRGPLELVWCPDSGLLQLKHSYSLSEMYGDNYGYRSGLNASMVAHLQNKVAGLERVRPTRPGDLVLDIGSNDATLLKAFRASGIRKLGIDPTGAKFQSFYTGDIALVPEFFSVDAFQDAAEGKRAAIITSIAMFYDLEHPLTFVRDISLALASDGIWHFEQSYMPSMLRTNSYDTVCHEHLEYYSLGVVDKLLKACGLRIVNVQMNSVNGGSFAVTACHADAPFISNTTLIDWMLHQEENLGLSSPKPYRQFEERVFQHKNDLRRLVESLVADGKKVIGYGASTKGNVLLQFCRLDASLVPAIAEVNPDKFGSFTPGTHIPIVSEQEARAMKPDYFLVLPWHFKEGILRREQEYLRSGGKLIFPLPEIEIVGD
jgi:C-methyltransferase C-terminal domain/Putative zinc binding domain/Methyltransferase domain